MTTRNKVWAAFISALLAGAALLCLPQVWVRVELIEPGLPVVEEPLTGSAIAQIGSPALLVVLAASLALLAIRGFLIYLIVFFWLGAGGASAYVGLSFLLDPSQSGVDAAQSTLTSQGEIGVAGVSYVAASIYTIACVGVLVVATWLAVTARKRVAESQKATKYERDSYRTGATDHLAIWDAQDAGLDLTKGTQKP